MVIFGGIDVCAY